MATFAVIVVALVAAIVSYAHIYSLARHLGQPKPLAILLPLSVDGAVGAASASLLSAARSGKHGAPVVTKLMLAAGVLATLAANAYSGTGHGIPGMAVAMWPGIAFVGSTEVALSMTRVAARARVKAEARARSTASVARSKARRIARANPAISNAALARRTGLSPEKAKQIKAGLVTPDPAYPIPKVLNLCMTGTQLWNVMQGAHAMYPAWPSNLTEDQHDLVASFLDNVHDWMDVGGMEGSYTVGRDAAKHLSEQIKEINEAGLFVGARRRHCLLTGGVGDPSQWAVFDIQIEPISEASLVDEEGQVIWPPVS